MNPYIVQGVTLVFYDGEREELSILDNIDSTATLIRAAEAEIKRLTNETENTDS